MSIVTKALDFIGDVTSIGNVKDAVKTVIGAITANPDLEKQVREFELEKMRIELAENASVRDLLKLEIGSEDKFVRRVRPATIWCVMAIIATNFIVLPVLNVILTTAGADPLVISYPDLPENVYWLFGSLFGLYTGARSWDKKNKRKNGVGK